MPLRLAAQNSEGEPDQLSGRGSIPEELLRPRRGESARYPIDTVIGELGRGTASEAAYAFAGTVASGLVSLKMDHSALASINEVLRDGYLTVLGRITPQSYRLGGGRQEADGAFSFLIRLIGKEEGITGELYVRLVERQVEEVQDGNVETRTVRNWVFEDLILEEAKTREAEQQESLQRFDFSPYERFF